MNIAYVSVSSSYIVRYTVVYMYTIYLPLKMLFAVKRICTVTHCMSRSCNTIGYGCDAKQGCFGFP